MTRKNLQSILVCDDDANYRQAVQHLLRSKYEVMSVCNITEAKAILRKRMPDILLLDVNIEQERDGLQSIPDFKKVHPELTIVVTSGMTDLSVVRQAMQLGASDFLPKSLPPEEVILSLERASKIHQLENSRLQQISENKRSHRTYQLIGESPAICKLRNMLDKLQNSEANVLITGETGTGKEVVARMLRKENEDGSLAPFASVDSSTINSNLAESILFGHEKGAFTGAENQRRGIFEEANDGIIFFDEIGNMPLEIQAKLLRVLQEKEITRLGSSRAIPLQFRVVAATNKSLEDLVKEGQFKDDLYQRISVIPIQICPLRERTEDIPILIEHFLSQSGRSLHFSEECLEFLKKYNWPGNIRELQNTISYLLTFCNQEEVLIQDLPEKIRNHPRTPSSPSFSDKSFYGRVAQFEAELLQTEYNLIGGNISALAQKLNMDRSHLYAKLKFYGIHVPKEKKSVTA